MADAELSSKLYEKMSAEQDKFRSWLMDQPPADILDHAVEYAVREDILMEMEALELPDDQARALLASPDTMADIYKTFSKMSDTGHMDVVRESIEDRAATLSMEQAVEQAVQEDVQREMDMQGKQEAVYLVDRAFLLHLKETENGDFEYAVFDKQTKQKTAEGSISLDEVLDGIDPTRDHLAAARDAAIGAAGLEGVEAAQVGLTSLKDFRDSDIRRRSMTPTDYGTLMDKAAARAEEALGEKRESVLGQLSALKSGQKDKPSPAPEKKHREESR